MRPEARLARSPREAMHCAAAPSLTRAPTAPWATQAPMPTPPRQMCQERRVGEPTSRGQPQVTAARPPRRPGIPPLLVPVIGHPTPGLVEDWPPQRHGSSTLDEREAHETSGLPPGGRVQGQRQPRGSPLGEGVRDERTSEGRHVEPCRLEPPRQPTHGALRVRGSAVHGGGPGRATNVSSVHEAPHHPGQGLERPQIPPVLRWASAFDQRLRETRRALQGDPPWTPVVPKSGSTELRRVAGPASLVSVNQGQRVRRLPPTQLSGARGKNSLRGQYVRS